MSPRSRLLQRPLVWRNSRQLCDTRRPLSPRNKNVSPPLVSCHVKVALEYLLKGPTASGEQVKAEVKAKLSDEHIKVSAESSKRP